MLCQRMFKTRKENTYVLLITGEDYRSIPFWFTSTTNEDMFRYKS
jgi:hypothetical protein